MVNFRAPDKSKTERWIRIARLLGISEQAYYPEVRVISDRSGSSNYSFGAILNEIDQIDL